MFIVHSNRYRGGSLLHAVEAQRCSRAKFSLLESPPPAERGNGLRQRRLRYMEGNRNGYRLLEQRTFARPMWTTSPRRLCNGPLFSQRTGSGGAFGDVDRVAAEILRRGL